MSLLLPSTEKYSFNGIGDASAAVVMALLAANPATLPLTVGLIPGKVIFYILSKFFAVFASKGVVILNIGAEKLLVAAEKSNFDGTMDSSIKLVDQLNATGVVMTPAQIKAIDDGVILQFRKFAKMTRGK